MLCVFAVVMIDFAFVSFYIDKGVGFLDFLK